MQAFNLQAFNKYRLQYRRFPVKFVNFLRTPFFTEYLRWLLLANGVPYLVKLQVTFFIKKLNFIHQWFLPQFKKSFISEKPFAEHGLRIEILKITFHLLKEKKRLLFRATRFSIEKYWSMNLKQCRCARN